MFTDKYKQTKKEKKDFVAVWRETKVWSILNKPTHFEDEI